MKKKFENMERRGLPGGPNEMFSYVTGVFSTEGYKSDSPDKNNPANLIASGSITMEDVEFPVLGMDNLGNSKIMMPGNNYQFPGDMVIELPMMADGGRCWPGYKPVSGKMAYSKGSCEKAEDGLELSTKQRGGNTLDDKIVFPLAKKLAAAADATSDFITEKTDDIYNMIKPEITQEDRQFIFDNVRPLSYPTLTTMATTGANLLLKKAGFDTTTPPALDSDGDYQIGDEAWAKSLGVATKDKYILPQEEYKPSSAKDSDAKYFKLHDDVIDYTKIMKELSSKDVDHVQYFESLAPFLKKGFMDETEFEQIDPLQNFKVSVGYDEEKKQKYISIYDKYDFKGALNNVIKPYEFYDRYYLPKGQKGVEQGSSKRTRVDIYKDINRLNQQIRDTDSQLDQFRKNIGTIYKGFQQAGDETLSDEQRQTEIDTLLTDSPINPGLFVADTSNPNEGRVIGLDSVPKVTRDWLRSIGGYGCTTYGCGLLRQAGAVTEEGKPFPMISGNSQLNSMIERNEGGLQMKLMDPGFSDLVAGDRIVSNYSTSGGDGDAHTMIFTGEYDADGSPIVMENSGGWVPGGVSIRSLQDIKGYRDTSDPESGLRVTRYNLGRDKLQSELDKLKEEYMAADPEAQIQLSELKPASVNITPIEQQLEEAVNVTIPINATQRLKPKKQLAGEISSDILLRQVFAESSLDPSAVSPAGARGIAQFMPNTEKELQRLNLVTNEFDPLDPSQARNAQEAYMNYLSERPYLAKGSPEVQLAKVLYAYNRGPNAAKRNLSQLKNSYDIYNSLDWLEGINSESRNYINKILGKDEKFSKEYENILLDSTKSDIVKLYKKFGGDVDLKRIYKNFLDGTYDGTGNEKRAKDIYDKLNRMYYREAKSAGMSMPNYVMTYIIGNS